MNYPRLGFSKAPPLVTVLGLGSHRPFPAALSQSLLSVGSFYLHLLGHNRARGWTVGGAEALGTLKLPDTPPEWLQPSGWKPWASQWRFHSLGSEVLRLLKKSLPQAENGYCSNDSSSPNCSVTSVLDSCCPLLRVWNMIRAVPL